ncbi:MAG TPA: ATP-binding protein [Chitinophagaceae bacterium]|nr:ATP-binding protein [Chitinophagaceae bacterium]
MAMQKSDELAETAAILFQQFKGLGQDLMQMTIGIVNEKEGVIEFSVTDWSGSGDRVNQSFNLSIQEPTLISKMYAGWKEQRKSLVVDLTGKELEGWLTYRNAMSGVTIRSQDTSGRRVITSAFFSKGHLSFSTPELPAAEHIQLLERFAGVFDLTYTRFLDLQKAEAQARESQIQLALERVRARTMAMQRSDELSEAASLLFQQVQSLGAPSWTAGYCIWDEDKKAITLWMSSPGGDIQPPFRAPLDENPTFIRYLEADNKGLELYIEEETAKVTEENYQYLLRLPVVGEILNAIMKEGYPLPTYQVDHCAYFSKGFLLFITYQQVPELHDIFKRFAAVFDQTYTRFLDLQKAEAQAREARIEAALEKVRSRTMGMQKSEELKEVIQVVFEQFVHLNILVEHSGFIIDYKEKDDMNIWLADQHEVPFQITIPYFDCAHWNSFIVAKEKGQDFFANHLSFEEKNKFYQDLFKLITGVTDEAMEYYLSCPGLAISTVLLDNVGLYIENFSGIPYSDQENAILMRFGKVFQQTYTRFLDLQQAEAQARESQIQLALERVRARTMAMQKSVELAEAAQVLYEEFRTLHINTFTCGYLFIKENQHKQTAWVTTPDGTIVPDFIDFPLTGDHVLDKRYEDWKQKKPLHVFEIQGEANKEHHRFLASEVPDQIANEIFAQIPDRIIFYCANFSAGYLFIIATEFLSSEEEEIIVRFAKVFELTYTRFSDLKQAETQARESQIQLALERVRASTMAMHRSEDLAETAQILFQQLQELGEMPDRMSIGITDEANGLVNFWSTDQMGSHINNSFKARLDERTVISKTYQAWKENKKSLVIELHGTELQEWIRFARQEMNIAVKDDFIKDRRVHNLAFFSHGWLLVTTHDLQSSETIQILERFASVFNLTYRRFLDLQKAEAQAKEAQIEAALERVRSRSMAMHQSSDLHEVVKVVTEQLSVLGIKFNAANFAKIHSGGSWDLWISAPEQAYPAVVEVPYIDHGLFNNIKEAVEKGRDFLADAYNKEEKNIFFKHFFENTAAKYTPDARKEWVMSCKGFARSVFLTKNIWLAVSNYEGIPFSNEENAIFKRFANAFEQTYTRFLDLQKAEANAREAQIEASLERVRSRSMAMHQSGDLQQVIKVVAEQFVALGLRFDTTNFAKVLADGSWDVWVSTPQQAYPSQIFLPYFEHRIFVEVDEMKASGKDFFAGQYTVEEKNSFFRNFFENTVARDIPQARKEYVYSTEGYVRSVFLLKNILFAVGSYDGVPYSDEENAVFRRFATVFEQAYTRFLDLQRAEAQAREAQIEASLERVRSKTMAMHTSDDVIGATTTLFTELEKLGIENLRCGISIINNNRTMEVWSISNIDGGKTVKGAGSFDMNAHPVWQRLFESWERKEEFQESYLAGKEKEDYVRILNSNPAYLSQPILEFPDLYREAYNFNEGALWTYSLEPHAEEEREVMKRFTSVFSLTFRRYQDLKKAEAQTREAQIEASLERVRAKAMAMHNSQDLAETIKVFYQQLDSLKLMPRRCGVGLITKDPRIAELMGMVINEQGETMEIAAKLILKNHPILENIYDAWIRQEDYYPVLRGNEIKEYYQLIGAQISAQNYPDDAVQFGYFFSFPEGQVYAWAEKEFTEDELKIYHRFTSVLSLTYKRYKDLKQAEAQAKEAQIEAGLERVRARTMAMHTSDDVSAATATMFTELEKLGIENFRGGITNMLPNRTQHVWSVNNLAEGKVVKAVGAFNMDDHPFWQMMYKEWQEKNDFTHYFLAGQEKEDYIKILNSTQGYLARAIENFPDVHFQVYFFNEGGIWTNSLHAHTDEEQQIMKRFTSVFSLTFRRYQDLRKAEAQAREATIEAALEKVRGKAMAMHNSNDLSVTASMVFTELRKLGINPIRCGVGLLNKESRKAQLYSATSAADGDSLSLVGWVILSEHPVLEKIYDTWLKNEEYYPELEGEQMRLYYEQLLKGLPVTAPTIEADKKQYGHFIPFSVGCLYAWSENAYDESEIKILKRFATIIDLTFRRYMELQTSEANAREAVKQAAFDRIRADIASMRKVEDLDRITPLIWNELTILGLPFIRCGIFLMDDSQRLIHTFLSTPDGKAIGAFHLPYDTPIFDEVVDTWRHKKIFLNHWTEPDYIIMADTLMKQGAITDREQYIGSLPAGGFHLHFIPFLQGMLYVGNINKLGAEEMSLIESVADAFSTAYARYEDFNKLEAAKQQVERTLTDLKQAQTQLVQSEKMASLGELTAGIAHEIQNPLNFVNNFSDVSNELLEEMKEELAKGNVNEAIAIAEDVKHNLEKINHHGKRADGIVKGMLQHSRSSSGQKEMTDINALADEYLRLAYHGLRAKDKSFNAKFETSFDDNVGKVNIIQQDIGRVILNLINNAFYAVSEKKKHLLDARLPDGQGYDPTVTLTTIRDNGRIEVKVRDNGNGISQKNLDKIFQPFFTTKPTGQGTGLGLSLAYDIVKAHGGEITVNTNEGEGSEFIVQLPVAQVS